MAYASIPIKDDIAVSGDPQHPLTGKLPRLVLGDKYIRWLSGLRGEVDARPKRLTQVNLEGQNASLGATPLPIGSVTRGIWRVSSTVRVTTPGGVSSSIQVSLLWTERGVVQIESGAALAGNLTTTREGKTFVIRSDEGTPISYASTYASNAAGIMRYSWDLTAELLAGDGQ